MTISHTVVGLALYCGLAGSALAQPKAAPPKPSNPPSAGLSEMLEERLRSVVTVEVDPRDAEPSPFFGIGSPGAVPAPRPSPYGLSYFVTETGASGSGFVVRRGSTDYVVTNAHVVRNINLKRITAISLTGIRYPLDLVGADSIRDIAVLKFSARPGSELTPSEFRQDTVRVGERVYALGTPLGRYPSSVSEGIVSGLNRQTGAGSAGYIQSTAALSRGNSGGPLIDEAGRVVGVNTFGALGSDGVEQLQLNFALNSVTASETVDQLIQHGRVIRGSLGLLIIEDPLDDAGTFGIAATVEDMPAALKDKLTGKTLISIQGVPVQNIVQLFGLLDTIKPNETVRVGVAASKSDRPEEVILTSKELTDARLQQVTEVYLRRVLGIQVSPAADGLEVRITKSQFARPVYFELERILNRITCEPIKSGPATFRTKLAGYLRIREGLPQMNGDDLYALPNERAFYLLARAQSATGILTFLFADGEASYAVSISPEIRETPFRVMVH